MALYDIKHLLLLELDGQCFQSFQSCFKLKRRIIYWHLIIHLLVWKRQKTSSWEFRVFLANSVFLICLFLFIHLSGKGRTETLIWKPSLPRTRVSTLSDEEYFSNHFKLLHLIIHLSGQNSEKKKNTQQVSIRWKWPELKRFGICCRSWWWWLRWCGGDSGSDDDDGDDDDDDDVGGDDDDGDVGWWWWCWWWC